MMRLGTRIALTRLLMMVLLCLSLSFAVFCPVDVYAQTPPSSSAPEGSASQADMKTADADGNPISCEAIPEVQGGKLLGKIVPCMIHTIETSTIKFAAEMVDALWPLLYAFLTLVVVLFGVRMLSQEPQIHKQGFLLLVKIAIIVIILNDLGNIQAYDGSGGGGKIIPSVYAVMNESQVIVAGAIDSTNISCDIASYSGPNTPKVWAAMDCIMGKLWGFTTGTDPNTGKSTTNMLLVTSFFGTMAGFFFGGAWGVTIFLGMLGTLFTIFMMVVRTAIEFLSSYLTICLLLILSPLLLPLAFLKITNAYFDATWRIILASLLTPVILTAYSMFSLILYDKVLFSPDAPIQKIFDYKEIKAALQPPRPACGNPVTNNPYALRFGTNTPADADLKDKFVSPFLRNTMIPTLSGANDPCGPLTITPLDADKINGFIDKTSPDAADDRRKAMRKIFEQLLSLFIIAYLISEGLKVIPDLIYQITGKRSASSAADAITGDATAIRERSNQIYQNAIDAFSVKDENGKPTNTQKSGEDFLRGLPTDTANTAQSIIKQITGKKE